MNCVILRLDRRIHVNEDMEKNFCVYMMTNHKHGTLYVGVTSDLVKRVWQHKNRVYEGFTAKYDLHRLVYYEPHPNAESAIKREKRLKYYQRQWKIDLIEKHNPRWDDLYDSVCGSCGQAAG